MDKRALEDLLAEYAALREQNRREEERRRQEISEKHPDLEALLQERHEMVLSSVLSAFSGGAEGAEEKMAAYNLKIAALLARYGYPESYLAPICRCEKCGDTGYVYDGPRQMLCDCMRTRMAKREAETAAGGETFAAFDEARFPEEKLPNTDVTQREYMRTVRNRCLQFARNIPDGPVKTLLLHGGSGLGKTFLLHCIEAYARERGIDTLFISAYDLLIALKNARFSYSNDTAEDFAAPTLLLIDDLGMEPLMENITVEEIYHLLNTRLSRGLYTALSTNLSRTELKQKYTERVSSRLLDTRGGMAIPLLGRDIRLIK